MPDPQLPLNCPRCSEPLVYVTTRNQGDGQQSIAGESHVYTCSVHGQYVLGADGYLRGGVGAYGKGAMITKQ